MKSSAASNDDFDDSGKSEGNAPVPASSRPHSYLPDGYVPIKQLGAGSVGAVYLCKCSLPAADEGYVAIKILLPEFAPSGTTGERFRREMAAYFQINHPNVVAGKRLLEDSDKGLLALVMEYVLGHNLGVRLAAKVSIPLFEALGLFVQICSGLAAIHEKGIIHRDLKPENLIITPLGLVKIADLGIAWVPGTSRLTEHGGMVGTLQYASPEYLMTSELHPRSDIYALGLIVYEMLTGRPPFSDEEFYSMITKRMQSDPPKPSSINQDVPKWLDAIVLKALARIPEERYQSVTEVLRDLRRGINRERIPISLGGTLFRAASKDKPTESSSNVVIMGGVVSGESGDLENDEDKAPAKSKHDAASKLEKHSTKKESGKVLTKTKGSISPKPKLFFNSNSDKRDLREKNKLQTTIHKKIPFSKSRSGRTLALESGSGSNTGSKSNLHTAKRNSAPTETVVQNQRVNGSKQKKFRRNPDTADLIHNKKIRQTQLKTNGGVEHPVTAKSSTKKLIGQRPLAETGKGAKKRALQSSLFKDYSLVDNNQRLAKIDLANTDVTSIDLIEEVSPSTRSNGRRQERRYFTKRGSIQGIGNKKVRSHLHDNILYEERIKKVSSSLIMPSSTQTISNERGHALRGKGAIGESRDTIRSPFSSGLRFVFSFIYSILRFGLSAVVTAAVVYQILDYLIPKQ